VIAVDPVMDRWRQGPLAAAANGSNYQYSQ
jgi:hypothetical protein